MAPSSNGSCVGTHQSLNKAVLLAVAMLASSLCRFLFLSIKCLVDLVQLSTVEEFLSRSDIIHSSGKVSLTKLDVLIGFLT